MWADEALDQDTFILTLCGMMNKERMRDSPKTIPSLEEWKLWYHSTDNSKDANDPNDFDESEKSESLSLEREVHILLRGLVRRYLFGKTMFMTENGRLGLGPRNIQGGTLGCE